MKTLLKGLILTALISTALLISACDLDFLFGTTGDHNSKDHVHKFEQKEVVVPDCVNEGYTLYVCSDETCKEEKKENIVSAKGHTPVDDAVVSASCTQDGKTAGKHCSVCNENIEGNEVIKAAGHKYGKWATVKQPTMTQPGLKTASCSVCGDEIEEAIAAHEHFGRFHNAVSSESLCALCNTANVIEARNGNSLYGYYDLYYEANSERKQRLYYEMYLACEQFSVSTADVEMTPEDSENGIRAYYEACRVDLSYFNLKNISEQTDVVNVWRIFTLENPAYYWLGNYALLEGDELILTLYEDYALYSVRQQCDEAISAMAEACEEYIGYGHVSDAEKARKIHDFLIERIDYAYMNGTAIPETAVWAHNIVGAAVNLSGVCETYAKTYLYLSLIAGIDCIIVSGVANGNEPHAWNYIRIDGEWYAVDATWDDGRKDISYEYFGATSETMSARHVPNSVTGTQDYLYVLPKLSNTKLEIE